MNKTILVAPLNWGLGHATRCIPIIEALLASNYKVIIGSDGNALLLLQKEFPQLESIELPAYNIRYGTKANQFKRRILFQIPKIFAAITSEKRMIKKLVSEKRIDGIISDNRFGIRNSRIPCVYMTHQINVLSGKSTKISSAVHRSIIKKFDECWVPDLKGDLNLSGQLGHNKQIEYPPQYIGPLSRFKKQDLPQKYDVLILLSGPEPQRTMVELRLRELFKNTKLKTILVRGVIEKNQTKQKLHNIEIYNFMKSPELQDTLNQSKVVLTRPGYTTIMDLSKLGKKAFFIPTPGQFEQNYLAKRLHDKGIVPCEKQDRFTLKDLDKVDLYQGLESLAEAKDLSSFFSLFERK